MQQQHLELLHGSAADLGLEGHRTGQQAAAVMAEGAGHQGLPLVEGVAVQNGAQARGLQERLRLQSDQGAGLDGGILPAACDADLGLAPKPEADNTGGCSSEGSPK